ncbi:hypothetical protein KCU87_g71, partial [Aureobasidium melanogenum]
MVFAVASVQAVRSTAAAQRSDGYNAWGLKRVYVQMYGRQAAAVARQARSSTKRGGNSWLWFLFLFELANAVAVGIWLHARCVVLCCCFSCLRPRVCLRKPPGLTDAAYACQPDTLASLVFVSILARERPLRPLTLPDLSTTTLRPFSPERLGNLRILWTRPDILSAQDFCKTTDWSWTCMATVNPSSEANDSRMSREVEEGSTAGRFTTVNGNKVAASPPQTTSFRPDPSALSHPYRQQQQALPRQPPLPEAKSKPLITPTAWASARGLLRPLTSHPSLLLHPHDAKKP